jgi:hypothetical protein
MCEQPFNPLQQGYLPGCFLDVAGVRGLKNHLFFIQPSKPAKPAS